MEKVIRKPKVTEYLITVALPLRGMDLLFTYHTINEIIEYFRIEQKTADWNEFDDMELIVKICKKALADNANSIIKELISKKEDGLVTLMFSFKNLDSLIQFESSLEFIS